MHLVAVSLLAILLGYSAPTLAHSLFDSQGQDQLAALLSAVLLAIFWLLYLFGSWRRPASRWRMASFHLATLLCYLAVLGPLDHWAETSASAHMTQHMLFMVVIAPLWVLSRPLPQIIAASGHTLIWLWRPLLRLVRFPMISAYLHGAVIWFWHTPYFYTLALEHPWWHALEHTCFLVTAGIFWWAVLRSSQRNIAWALFALLFTLMHTGFLGALLTFAQAPLYGEGRDLQDQQLAGLIMWVPGAVPYLLASMWVGYRWYRQMQRRMNA